MENNKNCVRIDSLFLENDTKWDPKYDYLLFLRKATLQIKIMKGVLYENLPEIGGHYITGKNWHTLINSKIYPGDFLALSL